MSKKRYKKKMKYGDPYKICNNCNGNGYVRIIPYSETQTCKECGGAGHFETDKIVHREEFDARHKLVNFYLHSQDPNTLHTWMCAIEKFKKEHNCQISIINDYLKDNQNYSFVDSYWRAEENFIRYYAGFGIGRFGSENVPDLNKNPDGIKGKNDLEIIEDILYHYTKRI